MPTLKDRIENPETFRWAEIIAIEKLGIPIKTLLENK
jgi:hypothetical protein